MTFADDETYNYIRHNHSQFCVVDVLEILPFLACLTPSDQDRLRASYIRLGNRDTLWDLFNSLKRRSGWVASLIGALKACELTDLAEIVAHVYRSHLPRNRVCPPAPMEPKSAPTEISGQAAAPSASINGYREDEPSYPTPVQDTRPPETQGERSAQNPLTPSSGAVPRRPGGPLESSSDLAALSPLTSLSRQEQDTECGSTPPTGLIRSPTSPRGPVSPSVSFQPLAHTTPRASRLPGPPGSAPPTGTSSSTVAGVAVAGGAGDQAETTVYPSKTEVPANSVTTNAVLGKVPTMPRNTVPSKGPTTSAPSISTTPSKLPALKPSATISKVPPPKLPINSVQVGSVPSSRRPEESPVAPAPAGPRGSSPRPEGRLSSELELSKPEELVSLVDSQPFSGTSQDLAISYSNSPDPELRNSPEEDEYLSTQDQGSLTVHVSKAASCDLLCTNSGLHAPKTSSMREKPKVEVPGARPVSWASWLQMAAAGVLLATALTLLYRRRLLQ